MQQGCSIREDRVDVDLLDVRLVGDHVLGHLKSNVEFKVIKIIKIDISLILQCFPVLIPPLQNDNPAPKAAPVNVWGIFFNVL